MGRKASFLECPKCGLRNKTTAVQCDFCGQSLTSDDDWQYHVKDLESLTKMDLRKPVDDRTSRRIESTIIRKDTTQYKGLEIKEIGSLENILKEVDKAPLAKGSDIDKRIPIDRKPAIKEIDISRSAKGAPATTAGSAVPLEKASKLDDAEMSESVVEVLADEHVAKALAPLEDAPIASTETPTIEKTVEVAPQELSPGIELEPEKPPEPIVAEPIEGGVGHKKDVASGPGSEVPATHRIKSLPTSPEERDVVFSGSTPSLKRAIWVERRLGMGIIGCGAVLYLVVLTLSATGPMDTGIGLIGGVVSSMMIIYGALVVYPFLRGKNSDEVFICPRCHEVVEMREGICPACGAKFLPV